MDRYYEQMTPAHKIKSYNICRYLFYVMSALSLLTIIVLPVAGIAFAALAALFYFLKRNGYIEYEYAFTSGQIDIDKIIEAKSRKRIISFDIMDVVMLAPENSSYLDSIHRGKRIIAYPRGTGEKVYAAVVGRDSAMNEVLFTPDEEFVNLCYRSNPKNVKKKDYTA